MSDAEDALPKLIVASKDEKPLDPPDVEQEDAERAKADRPTRGRPRFSFARLLFPVRDEQLRYVSQAARLEEGVSPRLTWLTAMAVSLSVFAFIGWAALTTVFEVTRTPGEVVPLGFEQIVQHLDGGIVEQIHVREGAIVEKDALLVQLDGGGLLEELDQAETKHWSLQIEAERLRALVEGREPDFSQFGQPRTGVVADQRAIFDSTIQSRETKSAVIDNQIAQKRHQLQVLRTRASTARANLASVKDIYERYKALHQKGHISIVRLSEAEQELNSIRGELASLANQTRQAEAAIAEYRTRGSSHSASEKDQTYKRLHEIDTQIGLNAAFVEKLRKQAARLAVRSPTRGIVKGLAVNTVGGVVQPGQQLMSILPLDERLVIEARISPKDIGHLGIGQPVQVRVSAYDYSRYGVLPGTLEFISATTFQGESRDRFYRGRIAFAESHMEANGVRKPILPGMTVTAEIITGERTILSYLVKPVHAAVTSAFNER